MKSAFQIGSAFLMLILIARGMTSDPGTSSVTASAQSTGIDPSLISVAEQLGKAFTTIADHVRPEVVSVFSSRLIRFRLRDMPFPFREEFFQEFFGGRIPSAKETDPSREFKIPQLGTGSGMILDDQGNILTNYHLVNDFEEIEVVFSDERRVKAKLIGKDARTDIAVIRVDPKEAGKRDFVNLGDSDQVKVGDVVIAIGAPFGLSQTVTHGIISAKGRGDVGLVDYEDFLQTDAPINPGNSGGPLVNTRGEIIGMNSAMATLFGQSNGVGFAIPSNMIKQLLPRMIQGEAIIRGELGVMIQDALPTHKGWKKGVLVTRVLPGSSAERAGIKVEDSITHFNEKIVENARQLRLLVAECKPGTSVKIAITRDGKSQTLQATISK